MTTPTESPDPRDGIRGLPTGLLWYLAECVRCGDDLAVPFATEDSRDDWAAQHLTATGHAMRLTISGLEELLDLHLSGILSRDQAGSFRYLCPARQCSTSNGPYSSAQLAIVSWRSHPVPVAA